MKISFVGWYGRNNIGDEAFRLSHKILFPGCDLNYSVDSISPNSDLVILGGGDVINSFYLSKIPKNLPLYILGAGMGDASEVANLSEHNIVSAVMRNEDDVLLLEKNGISAHYCPDITFSIDGKKYNKDFNNFDKKNGKKNLCILLSDHISVSKFFNEPRLISYYDYFKWELASALDYLEKFYNIYWIPFSNDYDNFDLHIHNEVIKRMSNRIDQTRLPYPETPETAFAYLSKMDLVISMKLHGILFSANLGVPFINIGTSRKTQLFCKTENYTELSIPPFSFTREKLLTAVKAAEEDGISEKIKKTSTKLREYTLTTQKNIISKWPIGQ